MAPSLEHLFEKAKAAGMDAHAKWGPERQALVTCEELCELASQVSRMMRGRSTPDQMAYEMADVFIVFCGLALYVDDLRLREKIDEKLMRLRKRLEE